MTEPNATDDTLVPDRGPSDASATALSYWALKGTAAERVRLRDLVLDPGALTDQSFVTELSSRALRAFEFSGIASWGEVLDMTVADLAGIRYLSRRNVDEVIGAIVRACGALSCQAGQHDDEVQSDTSEPAHASHTPRGVSIFGAESGCRATPVEIPAVARLAVVLSALQNDRGSAFLAERLDAWCPDIAEHEPGRAPILELLPSHLTAPVDESLWRTATVEIFQQCPRLGSNFWPLVLSSRVLVEGKPQTLAVVGEVAGVTRERVRQVEKVIRAELERQLNGQRLARIRVLACDLAERLGEITTPTELTAGIRDAVLATSVNDDETALRLRRGLLRIALGPYAVHGNLLLRPHVHRQIVDLDDAIRAVGRGTLLDAAQVDLIVARLGADAVQHVAIRDSLGLRSLNGWYVDWRGSLPDKAVAVLAAEGRPLTMNEIHDAVGFHVNPRSLANGVQDDERIRRLGKDAYGLITWGGEEYTGILEELEQVIERNGGTVNLSETVEQFVEQFGVSAQSVRAYAGDRQFIIERGRLRFRTGNDPEVQYRRDPIELTGGVSLLDGVWHLRIKVDYDTLRGSGRIIRNAIAYEAGSEPDLTVGFDYGAAHVTFSWRAAQPYMGSIRPVVEALGCVEGDYIFLPLGGPEPRRARSIRRSHVSGYHGLDRLQAKLGLDPADSGDGEAAILRALGLPSGADLTAVADRLRDRGEGSLVELLPAEYR